MKTIIFLVFNKEDGLATVTQLTQDIKANEEANHKLFFRNLFKGKYCIAKGEPGEDGKPVMNGDREIIFLPMDDRSISKIALARLAEGKEILMVKNCMCLCGDGEAKQNRRRKVIDWLLELTDDITESEVSDV